MKLALTDALVQKFSLDNAPVLVKDKVEWAKTDKPNYLVYDTHRKAPPGFAVRVGARASIYLVEKMVRGTTVRLKVEQNQLVIVRWWCSSRVIGLQGAE